MARNMPSKNGDVRDEVLESPIDSFLNKIDKQWLLYGGVAAGAILLYFLMRK